MKPDKAALTADVFDGLDAPSGDPRSVGLDRRNEDWAVRGRHPVVRSAGGALSVRYPVECPVEFVNVLSHQELLYIPR